MSNRSKRGPKKKKSGSPLKIVGGDAPATPDPKPSKVRPLPPEKANELRIQELKSKVLAAERKTQGAEEQLLKRDEMNLDLRKQIAELKGQALDRKEKAIQVENLEITSGIKLEKGEALLRIGEELVIGPISMTQRPGEKKSG